MFFLVTGTDGTEDAAPQRRMSVREQHMSGLQKLQSEGKVLFAGATMDDTDQRMIGSTVCLEFPSRQELDEWLASEVYVKHEVWKTIDIKPIRIPPGFDLRR